MLVLTKQDRLCHVIHATSDPFYQTWLRQFNVMQHCKVIVLVLRFLNRESDMLDTDYNYWGLLQVRDEGILPRMCFASSPRTTEARLTFREFVRGVRGEVGTLARLYHRL